MKSDMARQRNQAGFTGHHHDLLTPIVIILILASIAIPNFIGARDKAKISSVKANMFALQQGLERYARNHGGRYPDSTRGNDFDGSRYVPGTLQNPYQKDITGPATLLPDVRTTVSGGGPVYPIAYGYTTAGSPGMMRYFVEAGTHSSYAIIGHARKGEIIKETSSSDSPNFVLHPGRTFTPAASPPPRTVGRILWDILVWLVLTVGVLISIWAAFLAVVWLVLEGIPKLLKRSPTSPEPGPEADSTREPPSGTGGS